MESKDAAELVIRKGSLYYIDITREPRQSFFEQKCSLQSRNKTKVSKLFRKFIFLKAKAKSGPFESFEPTEKNTGLDATVDVSDLNVMPAFCTLNRR